MLFKIAWKNIWRNKGRSSIVIIAIAVGLLAGVFASAFVAGMMKEKLDMVVEKEMSHFQFHEKNFRDEFATELYMKEGVAIESELQKDSTIKYTSGRVISMVMIGSANQSGAIKAVGVDPKSEGQITGLNERVVEGKFFEGIKRNPILISKKTAEKYRIKLHSKVVLTFQDLEGEITSGAFRIVGIYKTGNGMYDEMNAFVRRDDLANLMRLPEGSYHELAALQTKHGLAEQTALRYQEKYPDKEVLSWLDLGLGMRYMIEMTGSYTTILVSIILVALLFSILNTMLMAVLERTHEIGMLMAIGMTKGKVFVVIMYETVYLSLIGGPLGLLLSYLLISYFGTKGIDMGGAYEDVGMANVIYPVLSSGEYIQVFVMVIVMAVFASIYPAVKALSLKPVEAMRK